MSRPRSRFVALLLPVFLLGAVAAASPRSRAVEGLSPATRPAATAPSTLPTTREARPRPPIPAEPIAVVRYRFPRTAKGAALYFAKRAGRMRDVPAFVDVFGSVQDSLEAKAGVAGFRDIWCVVSHVEPAAAGGAAEPCFLVFLPVGDYDVLLDNYAVRRPADADGITEVGGISGMVPAYVARRGDYAVIASSRRPLLRGADEGWQPFGPAGRVGEVWDRHDVSCYVNYEAGRRRLGHKLERLGRWTTPHALWPAMAWLRLSHEEAFPAARRAAGDAERLAIGASLDGDGFRASLVVDFVPDSATAARLKKVENTEDSLTAPLPSMPCWAAGGWRLPPGEAWAIFDLCVQSAATVIQADGRDPHAGEVTELAFGQVKPLFAAGNGSMMILLGDARSALVRWLSVLDGGGAAGGSGAIVAAARAPFERGVDIPPPKAWVKRSYQPDTAVIEGTSFGGFLSQVQYDEKDVQMQQVLMFLYGASPVGRLGTIDEKAALAAVNLEMPELRHSLIAAKARNDPLGRGRRIHEVGVRLPRARAAACYVFLDEVMQSTAQVARGFGLPVRRFTLPANVPPMGVTFSVEGRTARVEAYLPDESVRALYRAFREATGDLFAPPAAGRL